MKGVTSGHASAPSLYPIGEAVQAFDSKVREFHNAVNVFRDVVNALGRVSDEIAPKQAPEEFRQWKTPVQKLWRCRRRGSPGPSAPAWTYVTGVRCLEGEGGGPGTAPLGRTDGGCDTHRPSLWRDYRHRRCSSASPKRGSRAD